MPEDLNEDIARDLRRRMDDLSERIEELETGTIRVVADAVSILDFLKSRPSGWVSNAELRTLVGNGYGKARAALVVLNLAETRRVSHAGADGRGASRILTRYTAGGVHGRISRKRILEAAVYGTDSHAT